MLRFFHRFLRENRGAVTVDWVVMTALVMGLCVGATSAFEDAIVAGAAGTAPAAPVPD